MPLRVMAVQTSTVSSSETRVVDTLLSALDRSHDGRASSVSTLLLQGVDPSTDGAGNPGDLAAARAGNVRVENLRIGSLGRPDGRRLSKVRKLASLGRLIGGWNRLLVTAREFDPHVVYSSQQLWDVRVATRLARALTLPQVVHLHYVCGPWLGPGVLDVLRTADRVLCVSDFIRGNAIDHGVLPARAVTLRNSLSPTPEPSTGRLARRALVRGELRVQDDAVLVGMCARLAPWKGQEELLTAMLPILTADPRVHLVIAGGEHPRPNGMTSRMRQKAASADLTDQIHLLGHRSDVSGLLQAIDVFAHPSRAEPCAMAVLEAMAHGLPVVAWREGGTVELVRHGDTGILVEPLDIIALREALLALVRDDELRRRLGSGARRTIERCFRPEDAGTLFRSTLEAAAAHC